MEIRKSASESEQVEPHSDKTWHVHLKSYPSRKCIRSVVGFTNFVI
jgi:hypothetical protein